VSIKAQKRICQGRTQDGAAGVGLGGVTTPGGVRDGVGEGVPGVPGVEVLGVPVLGVAVAGVPVTGVAVPGVPVPGVGLAGVPVPGVGLAGVPVPGVPVPGVPAVAEGVGVSLGSLGVSVGAGV